MSSSGGDLRDTLHPPPLPIEYPDNVGHEYVQQVSEPKNILGYNEHYYNLNFHPIFTEHNFENNLYQSSFENNVHRNIQIINGQSSVLPYAHIDSHRVAVFNQPQSFQTNFLSPVNHHNYNDVNIQNPSSHIQNYPYNDLEGISDNALPPPNQRKRHIIMDGTFNNVKNNEKPKKAFISPTNYINSNTIEIPHGSEQQTSSQFYTGIPYNHLQNPHYFISEPSVVTTDMKIYNSKFREPHYSTFRFNENDVRPAPSFTVQPPPQHPGYNFNDQTNELAVSYQQPSQYNDLATVSLPNPQSFSIFNANLQNYVPSSTSQNYYFKIFR